MNEQIEGGRAPGGASAVFVPIEGIGAGASALRVARELVRVSGGTLHLLAREAQIARAWADSTTALPVVVDNPADAENASGWWVIETSEFDEAERRRVASLRDPVFMVRAGEIAQGWSLRRIMLAYDGTPQSASAFTGVVELGRRAAASVAVLHVATLFGESGAGELPLPTYVDQPHHEWAAWSREFLDRMEIFGAAASEPRLYLAKGSTAREIVRCAGEMEIDLLAMAWAGSTDLDRGATVGEVVRDLACPTMLIRIPDPSPWRSIT